MTHILITGASSGIGEALALEYAAHDITLTLCGRNKDRLQDVKDACFAKGATVNTRIIDVTDKKAMYEWITKSDKTLQIDMIIANAGVGLYGEDVATAEKTFAINIDGVLNTIHPILPIMEQRGHGQVVLMASIAGYVGLPSAPAYSASKNFVRAYGEALRGQLAAKGIKINVVCPGFVVSRLTDQNKFKMPFLMATEKAAKIIVKGLTKNKGRIAFPWQMVALIRILIILPYPLYEYFSRRLPDKA